VPAGRVHCVLVFFSLLPPKHCPPPTRPPPLQQSCLIIYGARFAHPALLSVFEALGQPAIKKYERMQVHLLYVCSSIGGKKNIVIFGNYRKARKHRVYCTYIFLAITFRYVIKTLLEVVIGSCGIASGAY
jgi:hypothetical protein